MVGELSFSSFTVEIQMGVLVLILILRSLTFLNITYIHAHHAKKNFFWRKISSQNILDLVYFHRRKVKKRMGGRVRERRRE